ncbi:MULTISPECIES: APC family permease [Halomonas]|uniref:APC family permease n=1 Tax=Halomonas TaxID=2745 RepID=UPI001C96EDDD|nr:MULTISPECIES: APC family permease [Halomonas]MBY5982753.1 APC family permease [Halomonas sp. DP5Y7-2]MBY6029270.1 APC family permease [Halomonas sp. DP8Y7-1]MBY6208649.1 APC family permease [Halomonas sp. DP3Y7-2]MBY6227120.1 APC family permease [Halomonas sp. DP3Y7-1]MCA0915131.1 APC family permease [Halomonas denitrificans]
MSNELVRTLGFWRAFSTCTGLVVAGTTMVTLGYSMGLVGPAFIVSAFIAMIVSILVSFSYSELSSFMPGAGMIGDYTMVAMGPFMAIVSVLGGYIVLVSAAGAMESITAGLAAQSLVPGISATFVAVVLLVLFLAVNLVGVGVFGSVQVFTTGSMIIGTSVMGVLGLMEWGTHTDPTQVPFNPKGWEVVLQSLALGIWLFVGIEYVAPMAEEVKEPEKTIPKAMLFGLLTIFVADMLFGQAIARYVPLDVLESSTAPQVDGAGALFGQAGKIFMVMITVLASASSINSHMAAVPRMLYGLAREGLLPRAFTYVHPRFRTPWVGIFSVFLLLCIPFMLSISMDLIATMILASCVTWLLSYVIAQINVMILRKRYPNVHRPFSTPFFPIPQIVGIAACIYMIVTIHPEGAMKAQIYAIAGGFMTIIIVYAVAWLKFKKIPLFTPTPLGSLYAQHNTTSPEDSAPVTEASAR